MIKSLIQPQNILGNERTTNHASKPYLHIISNQKKRAHNKPRSGQAKSHSLNSYFDRAKQEILHWVGVASTVQAKCGNEAKNIELNSDEVKQANLGQIKAHDELPFVMGWLRGPLSPVAAFISTLNRSLYIRCALGFHAWRSTTYRATAYTERTTTFKRCACGETMEIFE